MPTVAGSTPAAASAAWKTETWASLDGVRMFSVRPSWLEAVLLMTASTRSPSRWASSSRLRTTIAAALGADEAVGGDVEGVAASGRRQHALARGGGVETLVQHQHHTAGQRHIAFAVVQAADGLVHRDQARGAGGVHGHRGAVQTKRVRDAARRHAERGAGEGVGLIEGTGVAGDHRVVVVRHADEDTGGRAGQRRRREAGLLGGFPAGLQQHAVLRVHRGGLALVDAEEVGIEAGDVVDERAPLRHRAAGYAGLGVVEVVGVPAVGGNLGDQVGALEQRLPELVGRVDTTGQSAGHADDGDGGDRCLTHRSHLTS